MSMNKEMRRDMTRWLLPRLAIVFIMLFVAILGVYNKQAESSRKFGEIVEQLHVDSLRSQHSQKQHRVRQEECVIAPIDQIIRQRIDTPTTNMTPIQRCEQEEFLEKLRKDRDDIEAQLRDLGAFDGESESSSD